MRRFRITAILPVALCFLMLFWASLPPDDIAFDRSCKVEGMRARLSSLIYGNAFWRAQLEALRRERQGQETLPAAEARWNDDNENEVNGIERRMNHLVDSETPGERQARIQAEQTRRLETIGWLTTCESAIQYRLDHRR